MIPGLHRQSRDLSTIHIWDQIQFSTLTDTHNK